MHPPVDPWREPEETTARVPPPIYGRAPVPLREPTAELPVVQPTRRRTVPGAAPRVSWQRAGNASRRQLSDGWGFTAFGLLVLVCGWGVWAAAGGPAFAHPLVDVALVLVVGVLIFVVSRSLSRYLVAGLLRRARPHARWSHFFTGLYLTAAGISYFAHTSWLIQGIDWVREQADRL